MNREEIKALVETIVELAFAKFNEKNSFGDMRTRLSIAETILTGGDDPKKGLVYMFATAETQRQEDRKAFVRLQSVTVSAGLIMLGLFLTSVWNSLVIP